VLAIGLFIARWKLPKKSFSENWVFRVGNLSRYLKICRKRFYSWVAHLCKCPVGIFSFFIGKFFTSKCGTSPSHWQGLVFEILWSPLHITRPCRIFQVWRFVKSIKKCWLSMCFNLMLWKLVRFQLFKGPGFWEKFRKCNPQMVETNNGTIKKCSSAFQWMVMSVCFDNLRYFG
jgi:hypothetical protein